MSERLDYDREKPDYQESQPKYSGDPFRDYQLEINEHIEERERERERERAAEYAADPVEEGAEPEYGDLRFEEEAVEPGNDRGGVEHATQHDADEGGVEHATDHVTEHTTQHDADEGGVSDYAVARHRWRSPASRRQRGEVWIPPGTKELHAPVFVPLEDLTSAGSSEGPDETGSRSDDENRLPGRQEGLFGGSPAIGTSSGNAGDQG